MWRRGRANGVRRSWLPLAVLLIAASTCRAEADRSVLESSRRATGFVFTEFKDVLSMGTGFCIDASGLFITNNHVISDKGQYGRISIVLAPGTSNARVLSATIVKADPNLDLAVLRVDRPNNLHTIDLAGAGRMGRLRETQEVMALGYPFGPKLAAAGSAPEISVSTGKITALRHEQGQLAVIQFDGSINHGNSGGPLLDRYGNVIGVVTAIIPDKQINFAIPVSYVRTLLAEANIVIVPAALSEPDVGGKFVDALVAPPQGRRALPDDAARKAALKLVRELFAAAYADKSRAGQETLVYQLLDEERSEKDDPSSRYVLLNEAKEAAIRAGDFSAALYATAELMNSYELKPMDALADLIKRTGSHLSGQDAADGATASLLLIEGFARQEDFTGARQWIASTRAIAYASHNPKVIATVAERIGRVEFDAAEADRGQAAIAKLKSEPNDPAANLAAGRWQCFVRADFTAGCASLAKGSDVALKRVADAELAKPATPAGKRACGDLWWDQGTAEARTPACADACKARAVYWYRLALPGLTGLVRRTIEQRLVDSGLEVEPEPNERRAAMATATSQPSDRAATPRPAAPGSGAAPPKPVAPLALSPSNGPSPQLFRQRSHSVVWFHGGSGDENAFEAIARVPIRTVALDKDPQVLGDPGTYSGATIVVCGVNRWRFAAAGAFTDKALSQLKQFVSDGGDLVVFEQYRQQNMEVFERIFGVQTASASRGAQIVLPELKAKVAAAGLSDELLAKANFFNSYRNLLAGAVVLVKDAANHDVVAVVPFGHGRLILIGCTTDASQTSLVDEILDVIYHWRASNKK